MQISLLNFIRKSTNAQSDNNEKISNNTDENISIEDNEATKIIASKKKENINQNINDLVVETQENIVEEKKNTKRRKNNSGLALGKISEEFLNNNDYNTSERNNTNNVVNSFILDEKEVNITTNKKLTATSTKNRTSSNTANNSTEYSDLSTVNKPQKAFISKSDDIDVLDDNDVSNCDQATQDTVLSIQNAEDLYDLLDSSIDIEQKVDALEKVSTLNEIIQNDNTKIFRYYLYGIPHLADNHYWKLFIEAYYQYCTVFCFPDWINPEKMVDINNRKPEHIDFDLSKIAYSSVCKENDDKMHYTPAMKQYWKLKCENFDTLVLFKLGKFYELFYTDSAIGNKLLGLKWMGHDKKAHCGFPESALEHHCKKLTNSKLKVTVVEQMETPAELAKRTSEEFAVRREVCNIISAGTISHTHMLNKLSSYLMALYVDNDKNIAVTILDVSVCKFEYAFIHSKDIDLLKNLCTIMNPQEIVLERKNYYLMKETFNNILAHCSDPLLSFIVETAETKTGVSMYLENILNSFRTPPVFLEHNLKLIKDMSDAELKVIEFSFKYLEKNLLLEKVLMTSRISLFDYDSESKQYMYLPFSAIHALEVTTHLFESIDFCSSSMGSRMLYKCLLNPLCNYQEIQERRIFTLYLVENKDIHGQLKVLLKQSGDLERTFGKYRKQFANTGRGAVYFTEAGHQKLTNFYQFISKIRKCAQFVKDKLSTHSVIINRDIEILDNCINEILRLVVGFDNNKIEIKEKKFANYDSKIQDIEAAKQAIEQLIDELYIYEEVGLKSIPTIRNFVHTKFRYEIEIPETQAFNSIKTSSRKGYIRFQPKIISVLLNKLIEHEQQLEHIYHEIFNYIVKLISPCILALEKFLNFIKFSDCISAFATMIRDQNRSFPELINSEISTIELYNNYHPILKNKLKRFIPNDIKLNNEIVIITGPNMGGKSTFSRQIAMSVLLNQIGCPIYCESNSKLSLFDKLYTRIGIYDRLLFNQSTFYLELNEVNILLKEATNKSLLIIDEFGRGTSSVEGTLLASKTVEYISKKIGCLTLFTTHFPLNKYLQEFNKFIFCHMGISNDQNTFKLEKGLYPNSHGIRIAIKAGIPKALFADTIVTA